MTHLSRQEIRERILAPVPLVHRTSTTASADFEDQLQPDTIDLRTGIVAYSGQVVVDDEHQAWQLPPGEMAIVVTREIVAMPTDVAAEVSARQSIFSDGFLVLAAPHVDPGYVGPLTARIINLLGVSNRLAFESPMLTVRFYKLNRASDRPVVTPVSMEEKIQRAIRESRDTFHRLFVRPEDLVLRKDLRSAAVVEALTWFALLVPAIAVVAPFSMSFFWRMGLEFSEERPDLAWWVLGVAATVLLPLLALYFKAVISPLRAGSCASG